MHIIEHIFDKLGGYRAIASGTGLPVQTVHDWLKKGKPEIPPWRREAVLDFAKRDGKLADLDSNAVAYLASDTRPAKQSAAA